MSGNESNLRPRRQRPKRGPGRPATRSSGISKTDIVRRAFELCRSESLQSVSIVRLANEMGVTPALIHYYAGGRDRLTSAVMNTFYRGLVTELPPPGRHWRRDIAAVFQTTYEFYIRHSGIVAYVMSHNRFRLFQLVESGERDFGALFFERVSASVRLAGLGPQSTAMFAHLLLQHVLSSAYQQASRQLPEDHHDFLVSRLRTLDALEAPNAIFVLESFAVLRGEDAFRAGLHIVADAIAKERRKLTGKSPEGNRSDAAGRRTGAAMTGRLRSI